MKLGGGNGVEMLGLLWLKWRCRYDHISLNTHMKLTKNKKCISIAFFLETITLLQFYICFEGKLNDNILRSDIIEMLISLAHLKF